MTESARPTRAEVVAQALTDYWEPMRGYKEEYIESEMGQAEEVLKALDRYDAEHEIARVTVDHRTVNYVAKYMMAVKFPHIRWENLEKESRALAEASAAMLLTSIITIEKYGS